MVVGLRQPYRLEAAKAFPKDLSKAERMVARLEDAMEFSQAGHEESTKGKSTRGNGNVDQRRTQMQNFRKGHRGSDMLRPRVEIRGAEYLKELGILSLIGD